MRLLKPGVCLLALLLTTEVAAAASPNATPGRWRDAAIAVGRPLLAPTTSLELPLRRLRTRTCDPGHVYAIADYGVGEIGFSVLEGQRFACGNPGTSWPPLAIWWARHRPMQLSEWCRGCAGRTGEYVLQWRERGLGIVVTTQGLGQHDLLAIVRGLTPTPD